MIHGLHVSSRKPVYCSGLGHAIHYIKAAAFGFEHLGRTGSERLIEVANDVVDMFNADA
jgi:hypothetical protein